MKQVKIPLPKTEAGRKRFAPLERYERAQYLIAQSSDNWRVFLAGAVLGVIIGILIGTL